MIKSEGMMAAVTRRRYVEEFKQEAVRLVRESARLVVQETPDFGIPENLLYRWRAQHRQVEAQGTTRAVQPTEAEELTRLKWESARGTQKGGRTCGGVLREGGTVRYRAIQEYDRRGSIRLMCRTLAVSLAEFSA